MSNSFDPDQERHFVGPDLGPNCLQRLSADDNSLLARKEISIFSYLSVLTFVLCAQKNHLIEIIVAVVVFVFNVQPTAKVIWRRGHGLVSSDRLVKQGIEPATPGLHGKRFIHYTTAAPVIEMVLFSSQKICFG